MTEPTASPEPPERFPWLKPILLMIILLPLFAGGVLVSTWFAMRNQEAKKRALPLPPEDVIALRAENTLLKKMLGQVEGKVAVLGPTAAGGATRGKVAWDESLQQGFIHLSHLPDAIPDDKALYLWAWTDKPHPVPCARMEAGPTGEITRRFVPPERLLRLKKFQVTLGDKRGLTDTRGQIWAEGGFE
jgi:hypothetical protein